MSPERQRLARMLFDEYIALYASRDARLVDRFSENFSGFAGSSHNVDGDALRKVSRTGYCDVVVQHAKSC